MTTTAGELHTETETDRTSELSEVPLEGKSPSEYTLDVTILRLRAVAIPVAMAAFFVGVTLPFAGNGMQVGSFRSIEMDEAGRKELLDKYNERLGSLTALMMKPLDVTLSMVVAVIFLMLAPRMSVYLESRRRYLLIGVIGVVGYLMNTGFNAMNLQVVPGRVHPRIASSDLAVENVQNHDQDLDANGFLTTTWDPKFRESTPGNSVLNTIFRNLFLATENVPTWCSSSDDYPHPFKKVVASYGFPSRSWQQRVLSKSVEPTGVLSMSMNAAASDLPPDEELPMSVSNATNLAVYALVVSNTLLRWWDYKEEAWGSSAYSDAPRSQPLAMADYFNLTTRSSTNATFVSDVHQVMVDYFKKAENASTTDELAKLEFSHVDLSDTVVFDALTIEIPTQKFGEQEDNSSSSNPFYKELTEYRCNTQVCLVNDVYEYGLNKLNESFATTIYPRVQAIAICLNDAGEEELTVDFNYSRVNETLQACTQRSSTSMIIISLGKRVEGDSLANTTRTYLAWPIPSDLINARMVYSLTVGRLSWIPENLSDVYDAECLREESCYGVRFPLEQGEDSNGSEILLVSNTSTPMDLLSPINMNTQWFSVEATEWKVLAATLEAGTLISEFRPAQIVLPRNFKKTDSSLTSFMLGKGLEGCERIVDKYLNRIEKNHLYIEHTLQPAYTAGLYFVLQNAVVLKQINASDGDMKPSLEFSGNILDMHIRASIPSTSMILAFIGCFIMVLGGVAVAVLNKDGEGSLAQQDSATIAAEALDNTEKYPPSLLRLQLRNRSTGKTAGVAFDSLCVDSVVLAKKEDKTHQFAIGEHVSPSANTSTISRLDSAGA